MSLVLISRLHTYFVDAMMSLDRMNEYAAWIVRVSDGEILSKHVVFATQLEGDLVDVSMPDFPSDLDAGIVLITGLHEDVSQLVESLQSRPL